MSEAIRNFAIIAHIDHGKTTLTDRLLEAAGAKELGEKRSRLLDSNPIERERGITIKLAPVSFSYHFQDKDYLLNLIDTPGHVDFGYEVSRSLAACEGVVLLVDASQGVQAQTLTNFQQAKRLNLAVVPVINKIDLATADVEKTMLEIMELCDVDESEVVLVSAKTGKNVAAVLEQVIRRVPAPPAKTAASLRALLVTSYLDPHRGAIGLIKVVDGTLKAHQKLEFMAGDLQFQPTEVGLFRPELEPQPQLVAGQVGYVATGLKAARDLKIGDTLTAKDHPDNLEPLPGYREPLPMVFLEVYPQDASQLTQLTDGLAKLALRDAALQYQGTHSTALGNGFRVGFLGILHAEVALERLKREFGVAVIATAPTVPYQVKMTDGSELLVTSPSQLTDQSQVAQIAEPMVTVTLFTPEKYLSSVIDLCRERRGVLKTTQPFGSQTQLTFSLPLAELITDFHDKLKSISSGYASMIYERSGFQPAKIIKIDILINHETIEALSFLAIADQAEYRGRKLVERLAEVLPRQLFEVPVQAAIGGKIIARATLKAYRKDVTAKLYGGDVTRRKKLLAKQAKGKQRMKQFGRLQLDQQLFIELLKQ